MWEQMLDRLLRQLIVMGRLDVTWPDGRRQSYGPGGQVEAAITLTDETALRPLCLRPVLALGEAYMDGTLVVEDDRLYELLTLLVRNQNAGGMPGWHDLVYRFRNAIRGFVLRNDPRTSRRNVAHHYDLSDDLYRLFLDDDMQYSCAYFARPDMTLEEAQGAKKAHIAGKLLLEPDQHVLDIGCGWGGMALTLARDYGARVTGVTLSENQLATARARAEAAGLSDRIEFRLLDYRKLDERFDRIVSVGMLEHVGLPHFREYFGKVHDLLSDDGVALIHTIGRTVPPSPTSPWMDKYIFPGGYIPSLSDLAPAIERNDLWMADIEVWRGHYGPTLNHWRRRFDAQIDRIREMYDDRFIRMFRFYLIASEMAFEEQGQAVFHFQLSRRQHVVPATRNYLYAATESDMLRAAE
ncbi:MAG: cyclopropane-fatty-acyl-phospholipid synthase family protein [Paracoccaceae bacterium]|nr:cyclopropane-fatty-acyl-phospholipid synthase family protein [Paracoccaceae bacterium]